ncbi:MAG: DNA methyltransferase [Ktedonobacteraceae bacterium]
MPSLPDKQRIQQHLRAFDFRKLFVEELGWDNLGGAPLPIAIDGYTYFLQPLVQKREFKVYTCGPDAGGGLPDSAAMRTIERELTRHAYEHLIIYADAAHTQQAWQWVRREPGKAAASRLYRLHSNQSGELLAQKLQALAFSIAEEAQLGTAAVAARVRSALDTERVTKRFYDRFQKEHGAFLAVIKGITALADREWYASLMLNRLMFVYFIQKKGLLASGGRGQLDGDQDYLTHRLQMVREQHGGEQFYSFYRSFLLRLFHEGLGQRERSPELAQLLGSVPYLNGGLFDVHVLERDNPDIQIPDEAFSLIFKFFDEYQWHLDDRPLRDDREINPDVLGYIFEKYINQKQMGAYYTKEDITAYIGKNTIIPYLLEFAAGRCAVAFTPSGPVWSLLRDDPDRYIYDAVKQGCDQPLPPQIAAGIDDVSQRGEWNRAAPSEFALPTETWREVVARRARYAEVRAKLARGEISAVNDLVTYNLDLGKFAQDAITYSEGPDLLNACYESLERVTILDPTCGSGAFLFAALNILEPLYEACLDRMQEMVAERDRLEAAAPRRPTSSGGYYPRFRDILERVAKHPGHTYFILKSIIINNLYGVDIMEEATEICKLRLFLKLVAQINRFADIEPLPDIDFNIRAGNTLVGFATYAEAERAVSSKLDFDNTMERISRKAQDVQRSFAAFRAMQTALKVDPEDMAAMKAQVSAQLKDLNAILDGYLAAAYGIDRNNIKDERAYAEKFAVWRITHQPFHWFVEFYGIMQRGGFDVIIGNPPYVSARNIDYTLDNFPGKFTDLYAYVLVRSFGLCHQDSRLGLIVPLSITFSEDFGTLREILCTEGTAWFSSYDNIPAALFAGVSQRCTIWLGDRSAKPTIFVSPMYRWRSNYRQILMSTVNYTPVKSADAGTFGIPKLSSLSQNTILAKFKSAEEKPLKHFLPQDRSSKIKIGFSQAARNFVSVFLNDPPCLDEGTLQEVAASKIGYLGLRSEGAAFASLVTLAGEAFLWYWLVRGDGFDVTSWVVSGYLTLINSLSENTFLLLAQLGKLLHERRFEALVFKKNAGKYVGNYNYRGLFCITRRADLMLFAELGMSRDEALEILNYVQRVLSINEHAGEKSIPAEVKSKFRPNVIDENGQQALFDEIDRVLARHYGFTDEELDFIINYDIKYRMGRGDENGEEP